jgi:hypothetical protein
MTRRGRNPCLTCGQLADGPKAGVVCSECRRKIEGYDAFQVASGERS